MAAVALVAPKMAEAVAETEEAADLVVEAVAVVAAQGVLVQYHQ